MIDAFANTDWSFLNSDSNPTLTIDSAIDSFQIKVGLVLHKCCPTLQQRAASGPQWGNRELKILKSAKNRALHRLLKSNLHSDKLLFNTVSGNYRRFYRHLYRIYINKLQRSVSIDPTKIFLFINRKRKKAKQIPSVMPLDTEIASSELEISQLFAKKCSSVFDLQFSHSVLDQNFFASL